jgi:crotonobetainyl-CoA:carnitine CoA-transferase CaiB-like acyl-CoA transferase
MEEDMNDRMREIERRSRAAFGASVESGDAATRARLARARARALEELHRRRLGGSAAWIPAGAAAAALVAALLWQREESGVPLQVAVAFDDLEIVAGGEDFDLLREDADFVAWAAAEAADGIG